MATMPSLYAKSSWMIWKDCDLVHSEVGESRKLEEVEANHDVRKQTGSAQERQYRVVPEERQCKTALGGRLCRAVLEVRQSMAMHEARHMLGHDLRLQRQQDQYLLHDQQKVVSFHDERSAPVPVVLLDCMPSARRQSSLRSRFDLHSKCRIVEQVTESDDQH